MDVVCTILLKIEEPVARRRVALPPPPAAARAPAPPGVRPCRPAAGRRHAGRDSLHECRDRQRQGGAPAEVGLRMNSWKTEQGGRQTDLEAAPPDLSVRGLVFQAEVEAL